MQSASDVISSFFWFKDDDDVEEEDENEIAFEQFVQNVEDFSSQYGSEISVSYTAFNIRGPPSNFPDYGDYPQAFVMRTYGTWWEEAPSAQEEYMPQNCPAIPSQDFVEISFEREVYPMEVSIFETYNPGAIVRIWARGLNSWLLLWEGEPECVGDTTRIFSPPIRQINVPSRILRLEFNHRLLPYYTELDAVLLKGMEPTHNVRMKNNFTYTSLFFKKTQPVVKKVIMDLNMGSEGSAEPAPGPSHHPVPEVTRRRHRSSSSSSSGNSSRSSSSSPSSEALYKRSRCSRRKRSKHTRRTVLEMDQLFKKLGEILNRIIASNLHESFMPLATTPKDPQLIDTGPSLGDFQRLPDETILSVMKFLDTRSLCRCAQINKHFNTLASDAILYRCLDVRPYWHCVNSEVLTSLSRRCKFLQKLDLSWCGSHRMISPNCVVSFLKARGAELTHLRLNCCKFVDNSVLRTIVDNSPHLRELCLRSIAGNMDWKCLSSLTKLRRLDLYRTDITTAAAVAVVRSNRELQHLNVGNTASDSWRRAASLKLGHESVAVIDVGSSWQRAASLKLGHEWKISKCRFNSKYDVKVASADSYGSCKMISAMDEVAFALGACCPGLLSVDFWKSYSLSPLGIKALGHCKKLRELDVGWCLQAGGSGEWLAWLTGGELRKLFLGALRGICDRDLRVLLPSVPHLRQLDLLGVRAVTPDICESILVECNELQLLDVSFCDQIQESQVLEWREKYPNVRIKRSFQSANLNPAPNPIFLAPRLE